MTPNTTPAPMTHEQAMAAANALETLQRRAALYEAERTRADHAEQRCLEAEQDFYDAKGLLDEMTEAMQAAAERANAERTRADALAAERDELQQAGWALFHDVTAQAERAEAAEARIAELEAGIGRLADELKTVRAEFASDIWKHWAAECEKEARSLLRITHEEGRGNG